MNRQYLGNICQLGSGELVSLFPTLWMLHDQFGGYCRLAVKLRQHNLKYVCVRVPVDETSRAAIIDGIIEHCLREGKIVFISFFKI